MVTSAAFEFVSDGPLWHPIQAAFAAAHDAVEAWEPEPMPDDFLRGRTYATRFTPPPTDPIIHRSTR